MKLIAFLNFQEVDFFEQSPSHRLLELLNLVGVLEDKGVELLGAPDLELGLVGLLVLLDPGGYNMRG